MLQWVICALGRKEKTHTVGECICISEAHTREPFIKHTHDLNSKANALRGSAQANIGIMVYAEHREKGQELMSFNDNRRVKQPGLLYSSVPVHSEHELQPTATKLLFCAVTLTARWCLNKKPGLGAPFADLDQVSLFFASLCMSGRGYVEPRSQVGPCTHGPSWLSHPNPCIM